MILLGLCGYARSGKDAICSELGFTRCGFADELKAQVDPLFPENVAKEIRRPVYVAYGRAMRQVDPNYWISCLSIPRAERVCIADVRYLNEALFVIRLGGVVVRVHRSGVLPANTEEADSIGQVESNLVLPRVFNDGPISDSARAVSKFLEERGQKSTFL